jgi:hypothetical protein
VQGHDERLEELQVAARNYQRELSDKNKRIQDLEQAIQVCV